MRQQEGKITQARAEELRRPAPAPAGAGTMASIPLPAGVTPPPQMELPPGMEASFVFPEGGALPPGMRPTCSTTRNAARTTP